MLIKITERGGGWNLWATETDAQDAKPIYSAWNRTPEQLVALLTVVLGETPTPKPVKAAPVSTTKAKAGSTASSALRAMLETLDGWIEGAQENHAALGHRGENTGEECWRTFAPADIRRMINDAARELGVREFPEPEVAREDEALQS